MKIFSENEWDPLKEVIVGNSFDHISFNVDLSFKLFFQDNHSWGFQPGFRENIKIKSKYIEELNEDLEELVNTLEKEGVNVHRPDQLNRVQKINVEGWESTGIPALNVRDQSIIIGDTIVETAPCQRCRYLENDLLQAIYSQADGKHIKMPKSKMRDENFDEEFKTHLHNLTTHEKELLYSNHENITSNIPKEFEIMIDGANCVRFGKDILINVANRNQYLGYLWFKEHFPDYNWHLIFAISNNHLDSFIVPIAEGTLLLRDLSVLDQLPDFLKDWNFLVPPAPTKMQFPIYEDEDLILTSPYIDMNVLSLDGNKIITNSLFPELSEFLYKNGFDPIPVQHRHRRIFAGGFHCFTLDLLREKN